MRAAIIYSSKTGNTEEVIQLLWRLFLEKQVQAECFRIEEFPIEDLNDYNAVVIGTYTWGNGEIPREMQAIYQVFETRNVKELVTGVVGTGDTCYPQFCGAVNKFRDMLFVQTNLAVTLKIELAPQIEDYARCQKFVELILNRVKKQQYH
ncbi:flavodoxin domain-containing protein [Neobacillus mesonae]|uniref:Flavodoxin n=1 Tax=Neobacillus mesonae TaxID=1193713 RepID=A0A3Q9QV84_9BACI|nr:flavodoxin domain-containing protein [Neobacillus mesonae]AZU62208.1 flavodoxin [Neobacillus mesonae]